MWLSKFQIASSILAKATSSELNTNAKIKGDTKRNKYTYLSFSALESSLKIDEFARKYVWIYIMAVFKYL